tara:strand:+ start:59 stop:796 length:738 start_codon:yes stop_codon:yes gene_type:complete
MKRIFCILSLVSYFGYSQNAKLPFKDGESCTYHISYGVFGGGEAKYTINQTQDETQVILQGGSNSFVDLFFKIRDRYETIINNSTKLPIYFKRDIIEGGYKVNQEYFFHHDLKIVNTQDGNIKCEANSFDMLSSFLFGRSLKSSELKRKESLFFNLFLDEEIYNMEVRFLGEEIVDTEIGNIKCLKFSPKVQVGRVFKNENDLNIWISDDKNHILVKVELGIWVGSIDATITSVENIKFPLSITE